MIDAHVFFHLCHIIVTIVTVQALIFSKTMALQMTLQFRFDAFHADIAIFANIFVGMNHFQMLIETVIVFELLVTIAWNQIEKKKSNKCSAP